MRPEEWNPHPFVVVTGEIEVYMETKEFVQRAIGAIPNEATAEK